MRKASIRGVQASCDMWMRARLRRGRGEGVRELCIDKLIIGGCWRPGNGIVWSRLQRCFGSELCLCVCSRHAGRGLFVLGGCVLLGLFVLGGCVLLMGDALHHNSKRGKMLQQIS